VHYSWPQSSDDANLNERIVVDSRTVNWRHVLSKVKAALLRRGQALEDAEDLSQESWIRISPLDSAHVREPEAFMMRTALNLSIDAHRAAQRRGEEVMLEDVVLADCSPSAESMLLARERVARLSICLGRLTPRTREIFLAHRLDGKTYAEISREYGMTVGGVERHVAKALLQLTSGMEGW
jgi:RNA polymerase sigma factor (sigma-70 family)